MSLDLLPNNSTKLERGLAHSSDPIPPLGTILERIRDGKRVNIPDAVVDWLIYEYGLGEVTPYLTDPRQALREGVQWQRVRGTPAAVALGLGWIDFPAVVEESEAGTLRWAEYQLGLEDGPADHSKISRVVGISGISQPSRSRMFRIHGGWYDFRRFRLDDHLLSEGSTLCDHTGVKIRDDWPQLSFGREYANEADANGPAPAPPGVIFALKPLRPVQSFPADTFRLSINFLSDDDWHTTNHPGVAGRLFSFTSLEGLRGDQTILPELSFAKAQVVLSDSTALGDTNACLSPFEEVEIGDIFILSGDSELSEEKLELIRQEITERFDVLHSKAGANAFTPTVTSDFEHAFAYHQQLFDSFILGRSFLDDTAPDQLQGFNTSTVRMSSCVYGARAWSGTPWPAVTWDAPPVLADESRISGHFGTITYSGFAAISAGNTTETTSAVSFVALVDITEEISHQPLITEAAVNTTTSTSQGLPSRSTLVTSTMSYAGLSAFGSENRRYTSASVYTAASHLGVNVSLHTETASYPDSGQTWTTASWPPTTWEETQVIVGSAHATT